MATAIQKITLSSSRDIPFNKLVLSQSNVRRVKAGVSIEELAEDIARRTLLQGLNVRPVLDAEGAETGMFEIPAGGRRYRALELLVKQKRLAKTSPVPCVVRDPGTDILGEDDSLAENIQRAPLHPLDQFRAFQALREKGRSEEDIAAAFFVGVNVVKQRLRLASVAPALLDVYAEDGMSLEQLMAFTVTADHARQEQVWQAISGSWQKEPYQIRRMLTEKAVRASDRRAVFVGLDTYEAAGGVVLRDLFQSDDGGWLEDMALLDGLVAEKLKAEAETIAAAGWKWIEVAIDFPYGHTHGLRALEGVAADLTSEEQTTIDALNAEHAKLEAEYDGADELPDEVDERLGEIEAALAAFDDRPVIYDPADIARAGAFVSIDAEGALSVDRGYVRPQDEAPAGEPEQDGETDPVMAGAHGVDPDAPVAQRAVITIGGQVAGPEDEDDEDLKPLPDRLVTELTAERTLALRDKLATTPAVAFQEVARAGTFVCLGHDGAVRIERGFIRSEDEPAPEPVEDDGEEASGADLGADAEPEPSEVVSEAEPEEPDGLTPLSERLVEELTSHRTAGLQLALMDRPDMALIATVHALALRTFYGAGYNPQTCLKIEMAPVPFTNPVGDGKAARLITARHDEWARQVPKASDDLWAWVVEQKADTLVRLLAYCAARTVYAVKAPWGHEPKRLAHADTLTQAVGLNMAEHWAPTVDTYLGRVTKARILEAVGEGASEREAEAIAGLKKPEMASQAEHLLAEKSWLPAPLRTPKPAAGQGASETEAVEVAAE